MMLLGSQGPVQVGISTGVWPYEFPDPAWTIDFFRRAEEEWGFEHIVTGDRPAWPYPMHDSLILMAVGTTVTRRVKILGLLLLPYRVPMIVAKEAATIDYLSGGRTALALGVGGDYPREFEACGIPAKQGPSRLEEGMAVMRKLWSGEPVSVDGRYQVLDGIQQLPRPASGSIPLWLAHRARSEVSLDRTARLADGWLASWVSPRRLASATGEIRSRAQRYGRDPESIVIGVQVRIYVASDVNAAAAQVAQFRSRSYGHPYEPELVKQLQVVGTPADCRAKLAALAKAGAQRIYLQVECPLLEWEEQLTIIRREVLEPPDLTA